MEVLEFRGKMNQYFFVLLIGGVAMWIS